MSVRIDVEKERGCAHGALAFESPEGNCHHMITSRLSRRRLGRLAAPASALCLAAGLVAASSASGKPATAVHKAASTAAAVPLTIAGDDGGPFPASENPFSTTNGLGQLTPMIYEPLFQFDWLKPTKVMPWLATKYAWSDGGRALTVTARPGVKWSNGTSFSAADIAFTFKMLMSHASMNVDGLPLKGVTQNGDSVTLSFTEPAYQQFYYVASTYIVPASIWSGYPDPSTAQNSNPVGTGPYLVESMSPQSIILKANPNYWGGEPKVQEIVEPDILSNNSCDSELDSGQAQWGGCFLASFKQFKANKYNVLDAAPESVQSILPNLTKFPMSSLAFRKAVSLTLDRTADAVSGDLGEEPAITSPTGLVLPQEKAFLAPKYAKLKYTRSISQAKAVLKAAGFTFSGGKLESHGKPVSLSIMCVSNYSDNVASAETILQQLKKIGVSGSLDLQSATAFTTDEESGNYESAIMDSPSGLSPYVVYNGLLNDHLSAPVGKTASGDYERFYSPQAEKYLGEWAGAHTEGVEKAAAAGLEGIMINDMPLIPYMYGVAWGEYNTQHFSGWPSASNPYALGTTYYTPEDELVVLHLRPVN